MSEALTSGKQEVIYQEISKWLDSGKYLPGSQLPKELELVDDFQVARNTLRQALGRLESEGRIVRIKNRGTFVKEKEKELPPLTLLVPHPYIFDAREESGCFYRQIMNALTVSCTRLGTRVETIPVTFDNKPENVNFRQLANLDRNSRVLCRNVWAGDRLFPELAKIGCRVAVLTTDTFHLQLYDQYFKNWLVFNYAVRDAVYRLVKSLHGQGFRRIGLLAPYIDQTEHPIMNGYLEATGELGLGSLIRIVPRHIDGIPKDIFMNFCEHNHPDAIIFNPQSLWRMDANAGAHRLLGIPETVKLVGLSNHEVCQRLNPPLAALDFHLEDICIKAAEMLLDDQFSPGRIDYPGEIVEYETTLQYSQPT